MINVEEEFKISLDDLRRIRNKCNKRPSPTSGCTVWLDSKRKPMKRRMAQYRLRRSKKRVSVSKALYEAEFGKITENKDIEYCKFNDECVNPHHAKLKDKVKKE